MGCRDRFRCGTSDATECRSTNNQPLGIKLPAATLDWSIHMQKQAEPEVVGWLQSCDRSNSQEILSWTDGGGRNRWSECRIKPTIHRIESSPNA